MKLGERKQLIPKNIFHSITPVLTLGSTVQRNSVGGVPRGLRRNMLGCHGGATEWPGLTTWHRAVGKRSAQSGGAGGVGANLEGGRKGGRPG